MLQLQTYQEMHSRIHFIKAYKPVAFYQTNICKNDSLSVFYFEDILLSYMFFD